VNVLGLAEVDELWRWVVWVKLDLVDGWDGLARLVAEELLEVLDGKVGNTNVLDAAGSWELLKLSPGVDEVPVWVVLLEVIWVSGRWPVLGCVSNE